MVMTLDAILGRLVAVLLAAMAGLFSPAALAAVSANVDRNPVQQGEAFNLEIVDDQRQGDDPDLSVLERDFQIMNRASSSQISIVNGVTRQTRSWQVTLIPLRPGTITIPAIPVGKASTQPIRLRVETAGTQTGQARDAFIEFEAQPRNPHIRQLVRVDISLFVRGQLASGNLTQPQADGAVIESRDDQREESVLRDGVRYRKITRSYALYPERSGDLEVTAPVFSGEVQDSGGRRSLFGFAPATRSVYAAAQPITLTVAPAVGNGAWLPAEDVRLRDEITPARGPYTAGEPVTRVIELTVDGQIHTQVPDIELPTPAGARAYTEPTEQQTLNAGGTPQTVRRLRTVIIPNAAGDLTLPPVSIDWWNTATQTFETARLPARTLAVQPGAAASAAPPPAAPTSAPAPAAKQDDAPVPTATAIVRTDTRWPLIALGAIIGWTLTLLLLLRRPRTPADAAPSQSAPAAPSPSAAIKALHQGDLPAARAAVLDWARRVWGPTVSLNAIAARCDDEAARAALIALDQALYGRRGVAVDARALARWLAGNRKLSHEPARVPAAALPPLYPQT